MMGSGCLMRVIGGVVGVAGRRVGRVETMDQEELMGYLSRKG